MTSPYYNCFTCCMQCLNPCLNSSIETLADQFNKTEEATIRTVKLLMQSASFVQKRNWRESRVSRCPRWLRCLCNCLSTSITPERIESLFDYLEERFGIAAVAMSVCKLESEGRLELVYEKGVRCLKNALQDECMKQQLSLRQLSRECGERIIQVEYDCTGTLETADWDFIGCKDPHQLFHMIQAVSKIFVQDRQD